jgi:hypothetical protein
MECGRHHTRSREHHHPKYEDEPGDRSSEYRGAPTLGHGSTNIDDDHDNGTENPDNSGVLNGTSTITRTVAGRPAVEGRST